MKVSLFKGLSMITLRIGESKQPFLEEVTTFLLASVLPAERRNIVILFLVPERKGNVLEAMRV